jgi:hypothetical protein
MGCFTRKSLNLKGTLPILSNTTTVVPQHAVRSCMPSWHIRDKQLTVWAVTARYKGWTTAAQFPAGPRIFLSVSRSDRLCIIVAFLLSCWRHRPWRGVKNTFGISVNFKQYTYPILYLSPNTARTSSLLTSLKHRLGHDSKHSELDSVVVSRAKEIHYECVT